MHLFGNPEVRICIDREPERIMVPGNGPIAIGNVPPVKTLREGSAGHLNQLRPCH